MYQTAQELTHEISHYRSQDNGTGIAVMLTVGLRNHDTTINTFSLFPSVQTGSGMTQPLIQWTPPGVLSPQAVTET